MGILLIEQAERQLIWEPAEEAAASAEEEAAATAEETKEVEADTE